MHVVRNLEDERYKQSKRSSAGADKWLDVQVFDSTEASACSNLRYICERDAWWRGGIRGRMLLVVGGS